LKSKIDIDVAYATAGARAAIEKAGGTVTTPVVEEKEAPAKKGGK
jgi:hypothetical protein